MGGEDLSSDGELVDVDAATVTMSKLGRVYFALGEGRTEKVSGGENSQRNEKE
jgi:hypothetical protein